MPGDNDDDDGRRRRESLENDQAHDATGCRFGGMRCDHPKRKVMIVIRTNYSFPLRFVPSWVHGGGMALCLSFDFMVWT